MIRTLFTSIFSSHDCQPKHHHSQFLLTGAVNLKTFSVGYVCVSGRLSAIKP